MFGMNIGLTLPLVSPFSPSRFDRCSYLRLRSCVVITAARSMVDVTLFHGPPSSRGPWGVPLHSNVTGRHPARVSQTKWNTCAIGKIAVPGAFTQGKLEFPCGSPFSLHGDVAISVLCSQSCRNKRFDPLKYS